MMTVFVGLILFMIVVFMIVNGSFLEKYYISNKKSEFIKAYTMVQEGVENGTIDSETPEKDLGRFTEKNNISIAVIDSEYNVVYTCTIRIIRRFWKKRTVMISASRLIRKIIQST